MTVTIPNYFLEQKKSKILTLGKTLYLEYNQPSGGKNFIRNTMHGVLVVDRGSKKIELEAHELLLQESDIFLFSQGNYFTSENSSDYFGIVLFFDDRYLSDFTLKYQIGQGKEIRQTVIVNTKQMPAVKTLLEIVEKRLREEGLEKETLLGLYSELILLELYRYKPMLLQAFFTHILKTSAHRMRDVLEQNIDLIESVEEMRKLTRMSVASFGKKFLNEFGVTPKKWLDTQRMEKASLLLLRTSKSVTEVASECGFATVSWFIVQFKKYYKMTPKEYRSKNQH